MDAVGNLDKHDLDAAELIFPQVYCLQDALENGFIPALSVDTAGLFTRRDKILQQYARKKEPWMLLI